MAITKRFASEEYVNEKVVQPDWNQNDPTAIDFIKNRPFYSEIVNVSLINNQTLTSASIDDLNEPYEINFEDNTKFINHGDECIVIFDGVEYVINAFEMNQVAPLALGGHRKHILLGDFDLEGHAPTFNNYPFAIVLTLMGDIEAVCRKAFVVVYNNENSIREHTVTIIHKQEQVTNLDEKFIPNSLKAGRNVAGKEFHAYDYDADKEVSYIAESNAEIFNDYEYNIAIGKYSHAEGCYTCAIGAYSHAEGCESMASGDYSHAEGYGTTASGQFSHAEGSTTTASGDYSHAEGSVTTASGDNSHAEGNGTIASGEYQHVQGKWNIEDADSKYAHIVGNGDYSLDGSKNSNAHTLDWNGNAEYKGDVKANACGGTTPISLVETATIAKVLYGNITTPIEDYFSSGNPFVSADITFNDIKTAYDAGRDVKLKWESYIYSLGYESDTQFGFSCNGIAIDNIINVLSSGDIAVSNEFVK